MFWTLVAVAGKVGVETPNPGTWGFWKLPPTCPVLTASCPHNNHAPELRFSVAKVPELAASTGSACHTGEHAPNATLVAMGVPPEVALGAVRLSLGRATTRSEIEAAAGLLAGAHEALVATAPSPTSPSTSKGTPR